MQIFWTMRKLIVVTVIITITIAVTMIILILKLTGCNIILVR